MAILLRNKRTRCLFSLNIIYQKNLKMRIAKNITIQSCSFSRARRNRSTSARLLRRRGFLLVRPCFAGNGSDASLASLVPAAHLRSLSGIPCGSCATLASPHDPAVLCGSAATICSKRSARTSIAAPSLHFSLYLKVLRLVSCAALASAHDPAVLCGSAGIKDFFEKSYIYEE